MSRKFRFLFFVFLPAIILSSCNGCNPIHEEKHNFFRYNQSSGIASLDPAFSKDQSGIWVCNQLYNSLVQLDNQLNIKPCIAKNWEISEDGLVYTFHLRTNV